jgi:predicted RNase H-like nuclease
MKTTCIIGFDSAWTGKKGAICALILGAGHKVDFKRPEMADFDDALAYVQTQTMQHDICLVAVDQPTLVPNETGCRPVDRVAASLVSYIGGGVQPANRSKKLLFGDAAPFWRFKDSLGARECPEKSRGSDNGLFLIEVFPALALPALNPTFSERLKGPKYNPANRRFRLEDWQSVTETVREYARIARLDAVEAWAREVGLISSPRKADQDRLDSVLCAIVGYHWRIRPREESVMIGDLTFGYMVSPSHPEMRARLERASEKRGVPCI